MSGESRFAGLRRVFSLPRTARSVERDVDDEIRFHLDSRIAHLVAQGLTPTAARERALAHYGDVAASRRELTGVDRQRLARERWSAHVDAVRQDVQFALRSFRTRPSFTAAAVLVLALGIGANATMFGVIDRLLLRPPAQVADPARVMTVQYLRTYDGAVDGQDALSYPMYTDLRQAGRAFGGVAVYAPSALAVGRGPAARQLDGMRVTASFFQTLGVRPLIGRFFLSDEDAAPSPNVAVLSYEFWQREYHGDATALGRILAIGDAPFTVVGVAPREFTGVDARAVDVWVPLTAGVSAAELGRWKQSRNSFWLLAVTRLAPGVTRAAAAAAATGVLRANLRADGMSDDAMAKRHPAIGLVSILPREAHAGDTGARVAALLGAVSLLVLLIACANVANLQLARGIARRREIAIRLALGVSRGRLVMQLLTESVVLAVAGGAAALVVAYWGRGFVRRVLLGAGDASAGAPLDGRLLAFTLIVSLAVGVVSGVVPALAAVRSSVTAELKEGVREGGSHRSRARTTLLLAQTMLTVVLLVGTGLFVRSLRRIDALPLGLEPSRVLVATVQTTGTSYTDAELAMLYRRLLVATESSPGVASAALATSLPFYTSWAVRVRVPGRDSLPRVKDGGPYLNEVSPGYFATLGMRLVRGRAFTAADHATAPRVVVINESLARLWWPTESAIGKCMRIGGDTMPCSEIVGIAENSRRQAVIEDVSLQYFIPLAQAVRTQGATPVLLVRPAGDAGAARERIRRAVQAAAPNLPYVGVRPLEDFVAPQKRSWALGATMFALFGALALVLAAVGLYSVLAYDVAQRRREFGVRVALGASGGDVVRMVLGRGVRTALAGAAIGVGVALLAGRFVAPLLFETSPRDPAVFASVLAVVLVVAVLAALVPARRALRVDPIEALRAE